MDRHDPRRQGHAFVVPYVYGDIYQWKRNSSDGLLSWRGSLGERTSTNHCNSMPAIDRVARVMLRRVFDLGVQVYACFRGRDVVEMDVHCT